MVLANRDWRKFHNLKSQDSRIHWRKARLQRAPLINYDALLAGAYCEVSLIAVAQPVVEAAFRVHDRPGPGLLKSVYEAALAYELEKREPCRWPRKRVPVQRSRGSHV